MIPHVCTTVVFLVIAVVIYALWRKGDVSASMSFGKILEFKLDAKEKSAADPKGQMPTANGP